MFNLGKEIKSWKSTLRKNQALEDGYIEELESHLRDEVDEGIGKGLGKEEAFDEAVKKIGRVENVGAEYYKSNTSHISSRPPWQAPTWMPAMMYNYLKVAIRNIKRDFGFSTINITGLAVGIACVLFVIIFINRLYSYDTYHKDYKRIYRVGLNITSNNVSTGYAMNVPPLAPALKSQYPQVEEATRVFYWNSIRTIKLGNKYFYEEGFLYGDNEIFDVLSFNFLQGNPKTALIKPLSLVIPIRLAEKYFGTRDALNKTLNVDGLDYTITGVIENAPDNTHLPVDIFVPMEDLNNPYWLNSWDWPGMYTYIKVINGTDVVSLQNSIEDIIDKHLATSNLEAKSAYDIFLQPITDIYLNSNLEYELNTTNPQLPIILISIGIIILMIACFNYINLSTVRMIRRFKEIGIRKILGAGRLQLFNQNLNESALMIFLSFLIALLILHLSFPLLNQLADVNYHFSFLYELNTVLVVAGILIAMVIAAGFYPAIMLSSFSPAKAITNKTLVFTGNRIRSVLVIGQFAMSVILIFGTLVASSQIGYMKNKSLGFNKESKIVLPIQGRSKLPFEFLTIKDEFKNIPGISNVAVSSLVPGQGAGSLTTKSLDGNNPVEQMMYYNFVDADFIPFYAIQIVAGRNFIDGSSKDHNESCIINESSAKAFGWTSKEAIGKQIITGLRSTKKTIVGVVKDFHYRGMQYIVEPLVIEYDPMMFTTISLSANSTSLQQTVKQAGKLFETRFAGKPFDYFFMDNYWNELYQNEERTGNILNIFTLLSIVIASLGLLGLVSFVAESKKKEIGVRKVLGCSTSGIIFFMIIRFIKWIIIANVVALPLAYFVMNNWLENFPYRINIHWWIPALTIVISISLALITLLYQSVKAAVANPVNSIRYE